MQANDTRRDKHDQLLSGAKVTFTIGTMLNIVCQVPCPTRCTP